jgi:Triphosphoribosyl-dephospho-CoA synthetase
MEQTSAKLVNDAIRAMIYEVSVNPKPGLVDPVSSGPHPDMDVFLFIDSALSLHHYFEQSVDLGMNFTATDLTLMFKNCELLGLKPKRRCLR